MTFLRNRLPWVTFGLLAGILLAFFVRSFAASVVSQVHAEAGTATFTGSTASFSATFTQGGNQPIRTAFGPLRLDYKSGPNSWTTGLLIREGDGNVTIGAGITSADFNSASKLRVLGVIESTTGGIKFPDGTTQTSAASVAVGGGWTDGGTNIYNTTLTDNVGIGTTSPISKVHVQGTGSEILSLTSMGGIHMANGYNDGTWGVRLAGIDNGVTGHNLQIQTRNTNNGSFVNSMTVTSSGNVGIGTTGPGELLHIAGNAADVGISVENTGASGRRYRILSTNTGSTLGAGKLVFFDNPAAASRIVIDSAGNVGIGSTAPGAKLEVAGNINSSTGALQTAGVTRIDNSGVGTFAAGTTIGGIAACTGAPNSSACLKAVGTGTGSTGNGSIYFLNSSGTTMGRFDTATVTRTLPSNSVSFWHLDESSGSSVADTSGFNTGTATGTTIVSGKLGNARSFSSTSDIVALTRPIITGTGDFSISAWINPSTAGMGTTRYIAGNYGNGNTGGLEWYLTTGNILRTYLGGSGVSSTGTFSANTWYHVAVIRYSGTIYLYINGVQDGSGASAGSIGSSLNFAIGNGPDYTTERFQGIIDEVGTWSRALSASEVSEYYSSVANSYGTLHLGSTNTSSADLAEYYISGDDSITAGDVAAISNVKVQMSNENGKTEEVTSQGVLRKADKPYDSKLIGIISTNPGVIMGSVDGDTGKKDKRMLALSGRVPVKIDPESEPIAVGDFLTSSTKPGLAMKATKQGYVVGRALERWQPSSAQGSGGQSRIEAFLSLSYYMGQLTEQGDLRTFTADTIKANTVSTKTLDVGGVNVLDKLNTQQTEIDDLKRRLERIEKR